MSYVQANLKNFAVDQLVMLSATYHHKNKSPKKTNLSTT